GERADLAVEKRAIRLQLRGRGANRRIRRGEVVVLAREEPDRITVLQQQGAIAIQLDLVAPAVSFRQFVGEPRHHWRYEKRSLSSHDAHTRVFSAAGTGMAPA